MEALPRYGPVDQLAEIERNEGINFAKNYKAKSIRIARREPDKGESTNKEKNFKNFACFFNLRRNFVSNHLSEKNFNCLLSPRL